MNIQTLLKQIGVEFLQEGNHHCRPGWLQTDCPFCGKASHKFHLGFNLSKKYFHCWRCGPHSLIQVLQEWTGLGYGECKDLSKGILPQHHIKKENAGKLILPKGIGPLLPPHKKYLRKRGFNVKELETRWRVKGIGVASQLAWRVFIPIFFRGKMVSWTTRSIRDNGLRYISASEEQEKVSHKRLLYGEEYCDQGIIVHEGPLDVWATGPGAVAVCGTSYTQAQVRRIAKYPIRVICFDNEQNAQSRAEALSSLLTPSPGETYNVTLDAKDAAEAGRQGLSRLRKLIGR